jgi:hypothetical protein
MDKPVVLPPEDVVVIQTAAAQLMRMAIDMVNGNPQYAVGALSIALGTAAAMSKAPYKGLIDMLSNHYEAQLLAEVAQELKVNEKLLDKPEGVN